MEIAPLHMVPFWNLSAEDNSIGQDYGLALLRLAFCFPILSSPP